MGHTVIQNSKHHLSMFCNWFFSPVLQTVKSRKQQLWKNGRQGERKKERKKERIQGGARGGMVIVVGNGHRDTSSNPGPD